MVTMYFKLNDERLSTNKKYTRESMEKKIRDFFAKWNAVEVAPLTFQRDDEYTLGAFANIFVYIMHDIDFRECLAECKWNVDGHVEDCLTDVVEIMENIVM
jgi:hypothetical protein